MTEHCLKDSVPWSYNFKMLISHNKPLREVKPPKTRSSLIVNAYLVCEDYASWLVLGGKKNLTVANNPWLAYFKSIKRLTQSTIVVTEVLLNLEKRLSLSLDHITWSSSAVRGAQLSILLVFGPNHVCIPKFGEFENNLKHNVCLHRLRKWSKLNKSCKPQKKDHGAENKDVFSLGHKKLTF